MNAHRQDQDHSIALGVVKSRIRVVFFRWPAPENSGVCDAAFGKIERWPPGSVTAVSRTGETALARGGMTRLPMALDPRRRTCQTSGKRLRIRRLAGFESSYRSRCVGVAVGHLPPELLAQLFISKKQLGMPRRPGARISGRDEPGRRTMASRELVTCSPAWCVTNCGSGAVEHGVARVPGGVYSVGPAWLPSCPLGKSGFSQLYGDLER